ncbi:MAG TPA: phospholipase D-like domain-containing protein [Reyranella sp.]|nr:phospholipase D-like domain-containing protein [Reyranella sp.]
MTGSPRATLVESIPKGLEDLRGTPGVAYTEDVLVRLTASATASIDLTAMYWALLAVPDTGDEQGFTAAQLDAMGAGMGHALYQALSDAARRGVRIRILESPGFSGGPQESETLRQAFPAQVSIHSVQMGDWYGGGIMHQKIWVFDARHLYLGSANMDWKSIAQVKEMGVAVEDCPELAADVGKYFETWWRFAALTPANRTAFDPATRIDRKVPPWSELVPAAERAPSPFAGDDYATTHGWDSPLALELGGERCGVLVTGCPREVTGPGRTWDEEGLVRTIDDALKSISISVMDFAPVGLYGRGPAPNDTPVWWPSLVDALLRAVLTRKVHVRLLVSKWGHTSPLIAPFLKALQQAADAGRSEPSMSTGQLEIKQFIVPGWDSTVGAGRHYPGHTRVNHTKYIVTDRRLNIGTSNMTWDYFASTAGSSFNTDHAGLIRTAQAVFDRDWASSYAWHLS